MTKTSIPQIKIVNAETGEEIVRDMNAEELEQLQADKVSFENAIAAQAAKEAQRQAILDRLGLTADEAKLILG
jgi:hypothetical protein